MNPMWLLHAVGPDDEALSFRLASDAVKTVGRAPRADFILDRPLVSRLHCRLEAAAGTLEVIDLSSTNGIYVNGARVSRQQLAVGDILRVGRVELEIRRS